MVSSISVMTNILLKLSFTNSLILELPRTLHVGDYVTEIKFEANNSE